MPTKRRTLQQEIEGCVPTNWCDPLLTGPQSVLKHKNDCRDIEALLLGVQDRIRRVFARRAKKKASSK